MRTILAALLLFPFAGFAIETVLLDSIRGDSELVVKRGAQSLRLKSGDVLEPKDRFTTGPNQAVRLLFPDGSQVWVSTSAIVQVNSAATEDGHRIQLVHLNVGSGRVIVPKTHIVSKRIRFVIKTPTATMGVRGTSFVVDANAQGKSADLHTLEGSVDVARDIKHLIDEDVVAVRGGYAIHVDQARPIPQPKPFDVNQYEKSLYERQPDFAEFSRSSVVSKQPAKPSKGLSNAPGGPGNIK